MEIKRWTTTSEDLKRLIEAPPNSSATTESLRNKGIGRQNKNTGPEIELTCRHIFAHEILNSDSIEE